MKHSHILTIAILFLAAACSYGSDPGGSDENSGTVTFTYTAGGGDTYDGTGALTASNAVARHLSNWAAGWTVSADNSTVLFANEVIGGGLASRAIITINRRTIGTGSINANCVATATAACNRVGFVIAGDVTGDDFAYSCTLGSGTITITEMSETRAVGSFSGTGTCVQGGTFVTVGTGVTNGFFTVPLRSGVPGIS